MNKRIFLLFTTILLTYFTEAQTYFTAAGRASRILYPNVVYGTTPVGVGAMAKFDWVTKKSRVRSFEICYDQSKVDTQVRENGGTVNRVALATLVGISYGARIYYNSRGYGMYGEIEGGVLISSLDNSASHNSASASSGVTGVITPGLGYGGKVLGFGFQFQIAPSRSGVLVNPAIHAGFHFGISSKKKKME